MGVWKRHFEHVLNEGGVAEGDEEAGEMVAEDPCTLGNADITREEVVQALGRLKQKAAPGRDGLSTEMVCCDVLVDFWWSRMEEECHCAHTQEEEKWCLCGG